MKNKISESVKNKILNSQDEVDRDENAEKSPDGVWQKDIEKHDYYYDDSHGYEIYNADEDDEENDDD